jgi:hypothetical protein
MKNLLKFFMLAILMGSFSASAQTLLVSSTATGPTAWQNFNLPNPVPGPPTTATPYANYGGQPANWQTGPTTGWLNTVQTTTGGALPRMWVNEAGGEVYGVLFRTNFNLTNTNGLFFFDIRPDNQCEVFINGVQVGPLFNWTNGIVTVCVPNNILQVGNNIVAIQTTEWLNNATGLQFNLWQDAGATVGITPGDAEYCTDDTPVQYTGTPAGGTWAGNGMSGTGLFTPSTSNLGSNTLTYTVGTNVGLQPATCPQSASVIAIVEECCPDDMASFVQSKFTFTNTSTPSGLPYEDSCCTFGFKEVEWTVCESFGLYVSCYSVNTYNLNYTPSPGAKAYYICLRVVDCAGCEDEVCGKWTELKFVEKSNADGSNLELDENDINVYPNPSKGSFEVRVEKFEADASTEMYITDLSGQRVMTIDEPAASVSIENADLPAGVYMFVYKAEGITETEKILIHR